MMQTEIDEMRGTIRDQGAALNRLMDEVRVLKKNYSYVDKNSVKIVIESTISSLKDLHNAYSLLHLKEITLQNIVCSLNSCEEKRNRCVTNIIRAQSFCDAFWFKLQKLRTEEIIEMFDVESSKVLIIEIDFMSGL